MAVYKQGKKILKRLPYDVDISKAIADVALRESVTTGSVTVIGAVKKATIGYYDQEKKEYQRRNIDKAMEICSCLGNISYKEGETFVHAHITLADRMGRVVGGHLCPGTIIFAAECLIEEMLGEKLERSLDETTGLSLWSV